MKKILFLLLFAQMLIAQVNYTPVMDLLLQNKREDARKLFDKNFYKLKKDNIDLLFLDALIDYSRGKLNYDSQLLKDIEKLPNSVYYIDPFINQKFISDDINDVGYNNYTYEKIDFLAQSEIFNKRPIAIYRKAVADRFRLNDEQALSWFAKLGTISKWQYCGVFENMNGSGMQMDYEPEIYAKNDKQFNANSNGLVGWYTPKKLENDGYNFFYNEADFGRGIMYAQTFVSVPETKTYLMNFGCSSSIKIFINDVELLSKEETGKTNLDAFLYKVNLKKGVNRILVKVDMDGTSYFSVTLKELDGKIAQLSYSDVYTAYNSSKLEELKPQELPLDFEKYFEDLVVKDPNNILYKYILYNAYLANEKKDKLHDLTNEFEAKYPKSSFLLNVISSYYALNDDGQKVDEIITNMENDDKYCPALISTKLTDQDWLNNSEIKQLEEYRNEAAKLPSDFYKLMFDFMISARKSDKNGMLDIAEKIKTSSGNSTKIDYLFSNLKYKLTNNYDEFISHAKEQNTKYESFDFTKELIKHYNKTGEKEKSHELLKNNVNRYYFINDIRDELLDVYIDENKYDEALKLVDENLAYFPYSYKDFETKATIYQQLKNNKEAEKYFLKALSFDSSNGSIRKKIRDLNNTTDEIELIEKKDIYDFIKKKRGTSKLKSNYGVVLLSDEYLVNLYDNGSRKIKARVIYEITSEQGIEALKEYDLNTYSINLIKSEVVKKSGSIQPAEESGSTLVFSNLEIGDVIYVEYDDYVNSHGRFYKDFSEDYAFNGAYPSEESIFALIHNPNEKYFIDFRNGNITPIVKKINNKIVNIWKKDQVNALDVYEKYAPNYSDVSNVITITSISSWKEIANWYSDLVRKNVKADVVVDKTFAEIFPKGIQGLTESERAKKIYEYICQNVTYSFLDFRQSGHVPQKPSKTITSKLGDCKDLSTLFVTLGNKAGLNSNLVLVLTSDNGIKTLPLPSQEFNHCIVHTILDGKEYYLEMTDKYLPFKAMPNSLYQANALNVYLDKNLNENAKLTSIDFNNGLICVRNLKSEVIINEDKKDFINTYLISGENKSYYNELFSKATSEDVRKKEFEETYNGALNKTISNLTSKILKNETMEPSIDFQTQFTITEKNQKLGSLQVLTIPFTERAYSKDIINFETRNYDINYSEYEFSNEYNTELILKLPTDKKFIEYPESKVLTFKKHTYSIEFKLVKPNELHVIRKVNTNFESISKADFPLFKKYVEDVLMLEEQILGYK